MDLNQYPTLNPNFATAVNSLASMRSSVPYDNNDTVSNSDSNEKKTRKRYTITKPRESWTQSEHQRFLEALRLYERDWKQIEAHVNTKSVIQIRSHAQKYFIKMQKSGKYETVPPARPKRRSTRPYPRNSKKIRTPTISPLLRATLNNASDNASNNNFSQIPPTAASLPPNFTRMTSSSSHQRINSSQSLPSMNFSNAIDSNSNKTVNFSPWLNSIDLNICGEELKKLADTDSDLAQALKERKQLQDRAQEQLSQAQYYLDHVIAAHSEMNPKDESPNFSKLYAFLGSLFDPSSIGHLDTLKSMTPLEQETIQILMQNLATNLHNHYNDLNKTQTTVKKNNNSPNPSDILSVDVDGALHNSRDILSYLIRPRVDDFEEQTTDTEQDNKEINVSNENDVLDNENSDDYIFTTSEEDVGDNHENKCIMEQMLIPDTLNSEDELDREKKDIDIDQDTDRKEYTDRKKFISFTINGSGKSDIIPTVAENENHILNINHDSNKKNGHSHSYIPVPVSINVNQ